VLAVALASPLIVLTIAAGLAFAWYYAASLLVLFAGILFAVLLDACARASRMSYPWRGPGDSDWSRSLSVVRPFAIGWSIDRMPTQVRMLMLVMDASSACSRAIWRLSASTFRPRGPAGPFAPDCRSRPFVRPCSTMP